MKKWFYLIIHCGPIPIIYKETEVVWTTEEDLFKDPEFVKKYKFDGGLDEKCESTKRFDSDIVIYELRPDGIKISRDDLVKKLLAD
ncbi:MAG: hypothetical protein WDK96_02865 [Candidatus Paceibacterota bacterium]|jgi:hypothetical protein